MFDNIGKKIKGLASVLCWIGIIVSGLIGVITSSLGGKGGFLIALVGILASWVGSFVLYGFGELIDNVCCMRSETWKALENLYSEMEQIRREINHK